MLAQAARIPAGTCRYVDHALLVPSLWFRLYTPLSPHIKCGRCTLQPGTHSINLSFASTVRRHSHHNLTLFLPSLKASCYHVIHQPQRCPGVGTCRFGATVRGAISLIFFLIPYSVGYASRKALPIKRNDAESLTREDVQYDLLNYIFSDSCVAFTPQIPGKTGKVTFRDLYVNALYNSAKCSKVLKDKMVETPAFALEFAKICLLTNVGRINTTMACASILSPARSHSYLMLAVFPEMKTALRTYHPVPSLQKTDGNAQDAPRIKNCLKAALLPTEIKSVPPSTPDEILAKLVRASCSS